jgi:oxygen-independent coproporphyrinogen-3 oxidase
LPQFADRTCRTIFFGGGTPSLFSAEAIGRILNAISSKFTIASDAEISLEANPGTIHEDLAVQRLAGYRTAGLNRVSVGAQSFSDDKLKFLGRLHSAKDTLVAVENIRKAGFANFNLDLISAVDGETVEAWEKDLQQAIDLEPTHISAYGLTIEPGTEFHRMTKRGQKLTANEEQSAEIYQLTNSQLKKFGYYRYEISNYSKPGLECRHNLAYWDGSDYLGLGAGAHSFLNSESGCAERWVNIPGPMDYIKRAQELGDSSQRREQLTVGQKKIEFFMLGFRKTSGISEASFSKQFGTSLDKDYGKILKNLEAEKLLDKNQDNWSLTDKGFLFSDYVFQQLA